MTDAELDLAESLFRNPPSASGHHDLGLRLVAELRKARAPAVVVVPAGVDPLIPLELGHDIHAAPTPPASPAAKAKAKK